MPLYFPTLPSFYHLKKKKNKQSDGLSKLAAPGKPTQPLPKQIPGSVVATLLGLTSQNHRSTQLGHMSKSTIN